jgi:predicted PurR-regulated permease PerM
MMSKSWSKTTRYLVLILVLIATAVLLSAASDLIGPLAISALLAYILNPVVSFFVQKHASSASGLFCWSIPAAFWRSWR